MMMHERRKEEEEEEEDESSIFIPKKITKTPHTNEMPKEIIGHTLHARKHTTVLS